MIVYHDNGETPLMRDFFISSGLDFSPLYRNFHMRVLYRTLKTHFPKRIVFNNPSPSPNDDKIIVFDTLVTPPYLYWLCKQYPNKRIIFWYWNPADGNRRFDLFPPKVELWSYSPEDCKKYGFRYNTTFYFDCVAQYAGSNMKKPVRENPLVFFLGREKGRGNDLNQIKECLEKNGADVQLHLMKEKSRKSKGKEKVKPYHEVIKEIDQCDILLDYTLNPRAGLSLRPMESLFWGKKLITNNETMVDYDFYKEENIYILGKDKRRLKDFFEMPYVEPDKKIRDRYLLSNWLARFDEPENEGI